MKELDLNNLKLDLQEIKQKAESFARGNFGHRGRPGHVGGSGAGGGVVGKYVTSSMKAEEFKHKAGIVSVNWVHYVYRRFSNKNKDMFVKDITGKYLKMLPGKYPDVGANMRDFKALPSGKKDFYAQSLLTDYFLSVPRSVAVGEVNKFFKEWKGSKWYSED